MIEYDFVDTIADLLFYIHSFAREASYAENFRCQNCSENVIGDR